MKKYRNYTDEDVINACKQVKSVAQLLKKLDLKPAGGNYANIQRLIQQLNIDCSHWTGQGWNKGQQLKDWSKYTKNTSIKKHLMKNKELKCEVCLNDKWLNENIPLELHHIDGDRTNNDLVNLQLLCCNCHALTDTWRRKKSL